MHSTSGRAALKVRRPAITLAAALLGLALTAPAQAQPQPQRNSLRDEISDLLRAGRIETAIERAQAAVRAEPQDATVRNEYIELHLALAEEWLARRDFDGAATAIAAVLAIDPALARAVALRASLETAQRRAAAQAPDIDRLLRLELFDAALDRIREVTALRPDLAETLRPREQAATLGAADDHYVARNFNEAFSLYEKVIAAAPDAPPDICSRWAISLTLAIAEGGFPGSPDPNVPGRLLARSIDVLRRTSEPILGQILGGLLAEEAGRILDAGKAYSEALGRSWSPPPATQRRAQVEQLRRDAIERAREQYEATRTQRRAGSWAISLPDVWKQRKTPHFDVYARNDVVAERVAETLEFHLSGISQWLGVIAPAEWAPACEVRVYGTLDELHEATNARGITYAVSHTRIQGDRVLSRKIEVFQGDPWLLSATLPHELTHVLIADRWRTAALPLALDEGLALHTEPSARRLMYRRLLDPEPADPGPLLAAEKLPGDLERFYAACAALSDWILHARAANAPRSASQPSDIVAATISDFTGGAAGAWWLRCGMPDRAAAEKSWREWHAMQRNPPRLPLILLVEPAAEHRTNAGGGRQGP